MKKIVLKLGIEDDYGKRKALEVAAGVEGVDSLAVDMKEKKITVIGGVDPLYLTSELRKFGSTELLSVGPAKEEKKEPAKKEDKKPQNDAKKENKAEAPTVVYVNHDSPSPIKMKKIVLKLAIEDDDGKRKALKVAAGVQGVDSLAVDMKEKKITVIGDVNPDYLTSKLRKFGSTELLSVGPAKEEKKEPAKKEDKKPQNDAKKENKAEAPTVVYVNHD